MIMRHVESTMEIKGCRECYDPPTHLESVFWSIIYKINFLTA